MKTLLEFNHVGCPKISLTLKNTTEKRYTILFNLINTILTTVQPSDVLAMHNNHRSILKIN